MQWKWYSYIQISWGGNGMSFYRWQYRYRRWRRRFAMAQKVPHLKSCQSENVVSMNKSFPLKALASLKFNHQLIWLQTFANVCRLSSSLPISPCSTWKIVSDLSRTHLQNSFRYFHSELSFQSLADYSVFTLRLHFLSTTRYLEIQLKHRLLTAGNSPEDSPLDSLILTQYERIEEQTSTSHLDKKCPEAMDDQCRNEDMIHGGYGLEESKEGPCLLWYFGF